MLTGCLPLRSGEVEAVSMSNPKSLDSSTKPVNPNSENTPTESSQTAGSLSNQRQTTIHAVNDFLKQNSARPSRQCGKCGEPMQYMDAHFWLDGTDVASIIPLPFCPACEHDVLTTLRRRRGMDNIGLASSTSRSKVSNCMATCRKTFTPSRGIVSPAAKAAR